MKKRRLMVTLRAIHVKPGLTIRYRDISFALEKGIDEKGRLRLMIIDELDRVYWTRLNKLQYFLFRLGYRED